MKASANLKRSGSLFTQGNLQKPHVFHRLDAARRRAALVYRAMPISITLRTSTD
jgi:hypothetical protein